MNSEIIKERIAKVRKIMEREGVDVSFISIYPLKS